MGRFRRRVRIIALLLATGLPGLGFADELRGVALVIGAADYETLSDLGNPLNDARAMDDLLSDMGFDVTRVLDRGAERMRREIEDFIADAKGADVAMVYYAGHAVEVAGQNFLVPVDADISTPALAGESLVAVAPILDALARTVPVTIALLDACRTEIFPDGFAVLLPGADAPVATSAVGLGEMRGPTPVLANIAPESLGMVIGFAAAPGQPALDGPPGTNSPYAAALLKHLGAGNFSFGDLMTLVSEEVYLKTGAKQVPWVNSSLRRVLSFEAVEESGDDEALIRDGRRKLLLSIAAMPGDVKRQVEAAASSATVPMDTLYGLLDALGAEAPVDPAALEQLLKNQTETIRRIMAERDALTSTDTEIVRLADLAQRALEEGALGVSVGFWEEAKARYLEISSTLDETEAMLKARRLEGGALLARTAYAYGLSGDYGAAADNFELAFAEVARWDDQAALSYKTLQAEANYLLGVQGGINSGLTRAIEVYGEALSLAPEGSVAWANIQREIGNSNGQLAARDGRDESVAAAIDAYRKALSVFDRDQHTAIWAGLQVRMAAALSIKGEREPHGESLVAAIAAFHAALEVLSPTANREEWAMAQSNLGNALRSLGEREAGSEAFRAAVEAMTAALSVTSAENEPFEWAIAQNNLGATLLLLGMRENDPDTVRAAADVLAGALAVLPRERVPLQWAKAQANYGAAMMRLGETENDAATITAAIYAFNSALEEFTPERSLMDWATATNNLANSLSFLAQSGAGPQHYLSAVDAYRQVSRVLPRELAPLQWAQAQNNLGATLLRIGELGGDPASFTEALAAIEQALEEWTRERVPLDWAMAQRNLGDVQFHLGMGEAGITRLEAAFAAYRNASEEHTVERQPLDWASMQFRQGAILLEIALRSPPEPARFEAAIAAYERVLTVHTKERDLLSWVDAHVGLGWAKASAGYGLGLRDELVEGRAIIAETLDAVRAAGIANDEAYFTDRLATIDGALAAAAPQPGQ